MKSLIAFIRELAKPDLLGWWWSVGRRRANLKVVLMSATAEAGLFQEYFQQFGCMTLTIPGFTYPVQEYFLHDVLECTGVAIGKASRWAKK